VVTARVHRMFTLRQGGDEGLAVLLGEDAVIEGDDNALVGLGADEAAYALPELENGLGERDLGEGIANAVEFPLPLVIAGLPTGKHMVPTFPSFAPAGI
jgi:hypothetical protein